MSGLGTTASGMDAAVASGGGRWRLALILAGLALVVAAGAVLWIAQSEALFAAYLVSAIAGCF